MLLLNDITGMEELKANYQLFDAAVREGRIKPVYDRCVMFQKRRDQSKEDQKKAETKQTVGIEAPKFTLDDINGKPLSLESMKGQYVVLDFWGSWCVWCIKGFPKMKEYYAKYKGKFEIIGIDCSDTVEKWKAAVKKHEIPWLHVYCPKGSTLPDEYGVTGFPTKVIIGPDGKIVKTFVGEDPSFYPLLDELLGK